LSAKLAEEGLSLGYDTTALEDEVSCYLDFSYFILF